MLPPRGRSQAGPTPTQEIVLLEDLARRKFPVGQILDSIASARAQAAVAKTTSTTYASHIRMIHWACRTLRQPPLPASLQLISRVAALINNPNTQRGWLAAWRDWHVRERVPWAGDADLFLKKLRKGTVRLAPEAPPKPRLQLHWWRKLLKLAAGNRDVEFGAICNLAYTFAARVPSEIFKQLSWSRLSVGDRCLVYSNIYRKGKPHPCTLRRWCVCSRSPLLCWHPWLAALHGLRGPAWPQEKLLVTMSVATFTSRLRSSVVTCGMSAEEAHKVSSHSFRRGAGTDVLHASPVACALLAGSSWHASAAYGLPGMLRMGDWSTPASASRYATQDEQQAATLAFQLLELSEDES